MVPTTRITVVILELIRATNPDLTEGTHLLDKRSTRACPVALMIHDNSTDRTASRRRRIIQISALSTFDGRIVAYHGGDG